MLMSLQASVKAVYRGLGADHQYQVQPGDTYVCITFLLKLTWFVKWNINLHDLYHVMLNEGHFAPK